MNKRLLYCMPAISLVLALACGGSAPAKINRPAPLATDLEPEAIFSIAPYFSPLLNNELRLPFAANLRYTVKNISTTQCLARTEFSVSQISTLQSPCKGVVIKTGNDSTGKFFVMRCALIENAELFEIDYYLGGLDSIYVTPNDTLIQKTSVASYRPQRGRPLVVALINATEKTFPRYKKYAGVTDFIAGHKKMIVPATEAHVIIAVKHQYKLYYYQKGKLFETLEMALGQDPIGHKQQTGDNRTPEGEYRISQKAKGPFYSDTGPYLGNSWLELSYPNRFDAYNGQENSLISSNQAGLIIQQDLKKQRTAHNTKLGGLVGIHGWNGEWHPDYREITWGCISLQNVDIDRLYPHFPLNMYVLIVK